MNSNLAEIKSKIYELCDLQIVNLKYEPEGKEYDACNFSLNKKYVICRSAKITPKKIGQFVTFWRRNSKGITAPYNENDAIGFYVINVKTETQLGQFVFPKSVLINKGILSTSKKDGKRGFRVYPKWDTATNKQAQKTQKWQLDYFYEVNESTCLEFVSGLYT